MIGAVSIVMFWPLAPSVEMIIGDPSCISRSERLRQRMATWMFDSPTSVAFNAFLPAGCEDAFDPPTGGLVSSTGVVSSARAFVRTDRGLEWFEDDDEATEWPCIADARVLGPGLRVAIADVESEVLKRGTTRPTELQPPDSAGQQLVA